MTEYELARRPSRRSVLVSAVAGSFAVAASAAGGGTAALVTAAGLLALLAGVWTSRHRVVDAGALVAFLGVVIAALAEVGATPVVLGTVATVVAWDTGGNAISLGRQVGHDADTIRVEILHGLLGALVGVAGAILGILFFTLGPTHQPVTTLFVLLLGAAILVVALNR